MFVRDIICQLKFVKADDLLHPLFTSGRRVRVDVHPFGHLRVRLASDDPLSVVELVSVYKMDMLFFFIHRYIRYTYLIYVSWAHRLCSLEKIRKHNPRKDNLAQL